MEIMELNKAKTIAEAIRLQLAPFCRKIEIAGSIRRGKPEVHDIDIVAIPASQAFYTMLNRVGKVSGGPKIYKVELPIRDEAKLFTADVYIAAESTWATLLLIRTGSADHNKRLCALSKSKGMKLHADGSGLVGIGKTRDLFGSNPDQSPTYSLPIPCDTEADIFSALGLSYKNPAQRE